MESIPISSRDSSLSVMSELQAAYSPVHIMSYSVDKFYILNRVIYTFPRSPVRMPTGVLPGAPADAWNLTIPRGSDENFHLGFRKR
ncbi:MAG: hypothetical protein ACRD2G_14475, partial [Terriglobia bacterium]